MKNSHRGFVILMLIAIAVLAIGGGIYIYSRNGARTAPLVSLSPRPVIVDNLKPTPVTITKKYQNSVKKHVSTSTTDTITIVSPSGGESYTEGDYYRIAWKSSDSVGPFSLSIQRFDGYNSTSSLIQLSQNAYYAKNQSGQYEAVLDVGLLGSNSFLSESGNYKIRVCNNVACSDSNPFFINILPTPYISQISPNTVPFSPTTTMTIQVSGTNLSAGAFEGTVHIASGTMDFSRNQGNGFINFNWRGYVSIPNPEYQHRYCNPSGGSCAQPITSLPLTLKTGVYQLYVTRGNLKSNSVDFTVK